MINEKKKFWTVSWLSGLLFAEIFISTCEWGVQMPPLTAENSHFLRSGSQEHSGLQQFARPHILVSVGDETSRLLRRLECVAWRIAASHCAQEAALVMDIGKQADLCITYPCQYDTRIRFLDIRK